MIDVAKITNTTIPGAHFITMKSAADYAGVTVKTISYHINKSKKLRGVYSAEANRIFVVKGDIAKLYPPTLIGSKQRSGKAIKL